MPLAPSGVGASTVPVTLEPVRQKILMDNDTGIDDSLGLLYLLASPEAEIVGIASSAGNVPAPQVASNNLALLDLVRAPD
ncbi:nucleoside hydrolase, partial [Nocardia seriolae]|nr:nucleoside hydrolase [Nocardia seriolae]